MKELYRHKDHSTVAYYKSILESEGIAMMLRNEHTTMAGLSEIPIPEFFPNICVMNDEDYPRAWKILKRTMESNSKNSEIDVYYGKNDCEYIVAVLEYYSEIFDKV